MNAEDIRQLGTDPTLQEEFYRQYHQMVRGFLARRVWEPELAADLTCEVFLAAFRSARKFRPGAGSPGSWLVGIARNVIAEEARGARRRRSAEIRAGGRRVLSEDAIGAMAEQIDSERAARVLYDQVSVLPPRDRWLLERVYVDGVPIAQVASELGIQEGAAKVRLHRVRGRLKSFLTPVTGPAVVGLNNTTEVRA